MAKSQQIQIRVTPSEKAAIKRMASAAGTDLSTYLLSRALPPARSRVAEIIGLLEQEADRRFALAELHDLLADLGAAELPDAVQGADLDRLPAFTKNYVAAMVELAASRVGVAPPAWTTTVEPLEWPHFAVPIKGLRLHLLRASPVPFRRRNIFIDASIGARV